METYRNRQFKKRRLVSPFVLILGLWINITLFGQELTQTDSQLEIRAEYKEHIVKDQRFTVKYITPFYGRQAVKIKEPLWPKGIQKVSGPYSSQRTIEKEDGSFGTVLQVIYTLKGNTQGIFEIPPLSVKSHLTRPQSDKKIIIGEFQSKPLFIPILEWDERFLNFPLKVDWEPFDDHVYLGQNIPLIADAYNLEKIELPDSISLTTPRGAILEDVSELGSIETEVVNGQTIYQVPLKSWMLTPSSLGTLKIPSASVSIKGLKRKTSSKSIKVLPVPEKIKSSGAIGQFNYSIDLSSNKATANQTVSLRITLEGLGNLNYLTLPEPIFSEDISVSKEEESLFIATKDGFKGSRTNIYTFRPGNIENLNIEIPPFYWYNIKSKIVVTEGKKSFNLDVLSAKRKEEQEQVLHFFSKSTIEKYQIYDNPFFIVLFCLPGFLFYIISFFVKNKRQKRIIGTIFTIIGLFIGAKLSSPTLSNLKKAEEAFSHKEYDKALSFYQDINKSSNQISKNPYFIYNKGVLYFLTNNRAKSLALIEQAHQYLPRNKNIIETLSLILEENGLDFHESKDFLLGERDSFLLFILAINSLFLFLSFGKKDFRSLALLLLILFTFGFSLQELIRIKTVGFTSRAVINKEIQLKKIPEDISHNWVTLPEGTIVELENRYKNYILIKTNYNLEGWTLKGNLIEVSK